MANVIPDTNDVEVAKIAAALHIIGPVGHPPNIDKHLKDFAKVYKAVSEAIRAEADTSSMTTQKEE